MSELAPRWMATRDGRVTLMFTDIVGSTERLCAWGEERWLDALHTHNALVREAVRVHAGAEVKFLGDGWMVAFADPLDALGCAAEIRRALGARTTDAFTVRIGIHTGHAVKEGADFLGRDVIVASRLVRAARPGEILVSSVVRLAAGARECAYRFGTGRPLELKGLGPHLGFSVIPGPVSR